ncbi:MAG: class I SAM-dependent methyltransferase [Fusobacteriaceae bacterium]|nr:class I SAM-dependent methyltransferase [Fusobacteriaceae bacterium]
MFYESIAKVYDYIFPKNRKQLEFVESIKKISNEEKILDIGCATGNLTELLGEKTRNIVGIDLDKELLKEAKEKHPNLNFENMNMLKINEKFEENSFDRVVSFGNTLVHLDSREEVEEFFQKVYKTLKFNGFFIVQIINYNRVIEKNIKNLPTIDNEKVKFVRDYEYDKSIGKVDFITELTIKEANLNIKNNIKLLALTKIEIQKFLGETGFRNIEFYGDFEGRELSDNSEALIFVAQK